MRHSHLLLLKLVLLGLVYEGLRPSSERMILTLDHSRLTLPPISILSLQINDLTIRLPIHSLMLLDMHLLSLSLITDPTYSSLIPDHILLLPLPIPHIHSNPNSIFIYGLCHLLLLLSYHSRLLLLLW